MAVRAALAETQVVQQTKDFLASEGVSLEAVEKALLGQAVKRSDTTILVKNLPFTATQEAVTDLFSRFGLLHKIVLPPSRAVAVVDFENSASAKYVQAAIASMF